MFETIFYVKPNVRKYRELSTSTNEATLIKISKFVAISTRGIWKVHSKVYYLSNQFTNAITFGIILKTYPFSMFWHKFNQDIIMQTRKILL